MVTPVTPVTPPVTARTSRLQWLDAGLDLLRENGEDLLTIETLCARLGRTKGSYYHHFADAAGYLDALLAHWADKQTGAPIVAAETGSTPSQRRERLEASVRGLDLKLDLAVRAWALRDERAARVLHEVDARRVAYLADLHAANGPGRVDPLVRARLEYAAFIGAQQLFPSLNNREARNVEGALQRALAWLSEPG